MDQFGVEIRERAKWDIRESMVGTETFQPKHIIIATWKNVSFAGGITSAARIVSSLILTVFRISEFVQSVKSIHQYFSFFGKELSISRF